MRGCTVGAPVQSCNLQLLTSAASKFAAVQLLTKENLYFIVENKSRVKEVYAQTCAHLGNLGMREAELFGLALICDGEYLFVDPENKLSKYAPKHWKASNSYGLDCNNRPTFIFYFRVQYYVNSSILLNDDLTRQHYYLQLRHNVVARGLLHASASREALLLLAGFALQADLGDYDCDQHAGAYFAPHEYLPPEMVDCDGSLEQTLPALHRQNRGLSKPQAQLQYISEASSAEASRLTHNSHLYRLKHRKQEAGNGTVHLAICAKGIEIYEENSTKALTATFLWNNIGKLCFDRKKFEIRALNWLTSGDKYTYYTNSDEKSKHLLFLCRVTHQFSMTIQARIVEAKKRDDEERQRYRDCYLYSRSLGPGYPSLAKFTSVGRYKGGGNDQRISLISNTSSNTTSGIVSDRVQSLDESEDDLEMEIMINSPPALSEESLAFAHLRDSKDELPSTTVAPSGGGANVSAAKPAAGGASCVTPATTEGSQCSSSGSTVVVAPPEPVVDSAPRYSAAPAAAAATGSAKRRPSTSSSLELGFSHTAQNSLVSESPSNCAELDYSAQSAHASSGIFTLRSSDTAESAGTDAISSQTSGIAVDCFSDTCSESLNPGGYSVADTSTFAKDRVYAAAVESPTAELAGKQYALDGSAIAGQGAAMRERSDSCTGSIVSASGSFRGDGSDPTDSGPRNLLTAEELSDLIVGNGSGEIASGMYPSRATVSSTLDSDSDYVTLPPPPLPPPRTDSDSNYVVLEPSPAAKPQKLSLPPPAAASHQLHTGPASRLPPHYAPNQGYAATPANHAASLTSLPSVAEEANARFITTKPHINIITAHTSPVASTAPKSFAAPQLTYQALNAAGGQPGNDRHAPVYSCGDTHTHPPHLHKPTHAGLGHRSYPTSDPGSKMKPGLSSVPVIGKNNYLDVHASRSCAYLTRCSYVGQYAPPVPPPSMDHPRQPPPPPPHQNLATVYTSQVARGQIEQFCQQMYSDVDYVIYPLKDPVISKQEYMDAKQGAMLARGQMMPPPPYPYITTNSVMYRSTPNVASLHAGYVPFTPSSKYASNQNLACDSNYFPGYLAMGSHYSTSTSPMYSGSAASYSSSSTQSLRYEPACVPALGRPAAAPTASSFLRAKSNVDLVQRQKYKQRPPPPPPPPYHNQVTEKVLFRPSHGKPPASTSRSNPDKPDDMLDIRTLREKSKNLDLPLISALCNDRSLLKQTNAFVMPQHPAGPPQQSSPAPDRPFSWHVDSDAPFRSQCCATSDGAISEAGKAAAVGGGGGGSLSQLLLGSAYAGSKAKYPVSGLSATQMCRPQRRVSASTHTHPHARHASNGVAHVVDRSASSGSAVKNKEPVVP